jgi:hypothetical protein
MIGIDIKAMLLNNAAREFFMPNNIKIQVTIFQNNVIVWDNVRQDVTAQTMTCMKKVSKLSACWNGVWKTGQPTENRPESMNECAKEFTSG